jgi:uncharacterized membrane protein
VSSVGQSLRFGVYATAAGVYFASGYFAAASREPALLAVVIAIGPLCLGALLAAWNSSARIVALVFCAAGAAGITLEYEELRHHVAWLFFLQHAGTMAFLGIVFGSTLGRDHQEALCSRIATFLLRTTLDAAYLHYTWKVTLAWTVFFATCGVLSVLLFFFGPLDIWAAFANLLTPLLLAGMFAGEYMIRLRVMPDRAHFSIVQTIRAYREFERRR